MEYPRSLRLLSCALGWVGYALHSVLLFYSAWRGVWPIPIPTGVGLGIGIPVAVTGLVIYIMAAAEFRSWAWATGQPVLLIRDGIYRLCRHPQNLGWTLVLLGVGLAGRSALALLLVGLLVGLFAIVIPTSPWCKSCRGDISLCCGLGSWVCHGGLANGDGQASCGGAGILLDRDG